MALDSAFRLSKLPASAGPPVSLRQLPQLAAAIDRYADRTWAFQIQPLYCTLIDGTLLPVPTAPSWRLWELLRGRWLVLDHCSFNSLDQAILALQREGGNGYSRLLSVGAVAVEPSADCRLSGGSYANVQLFWTGGRLGVHKHISEPRHLLDIDAGHRLAEEIEWLRTIPPPAASLFPQLVHATENERTVGYVTEFVPGYTLAEQLLDGRSTLTEACSALTFLLNALVQNLYGTAQSDSGTPAGDTYLHRVKRRAEMIDTAADGSGQVVKDLLRAERIVVNGVDCVGLPRVIRALDAGTLAQHIRIRENERAHGDLILDDIIMTRRNELVAVDPSGSANSRLYDLGKLCLSLTTCYEFFKYDLFECEIDLDCDMPRVSVVIRGHPALSTFARLSELLPEIISESGFLDSQDHQVTGAGMILLNGLQNLALPVFHLLNSGKESRAAAFLAVGLLRVTQGLALIDSGRDLPLSDACYCIF